MERAETAERAERARYRGIAQWVLALLTLSWSAVEAQATAGSHWVVGGGVGAVIRTVHRGSFGWNLQLARQFQPARAFLVEPGVLFQHYARSSPSKGLCPTEGCPPPPENAIIVVGPEVRVAYRDPGSNPVYPVAGAGVYWVSSPDTSGPRFGTTLGLALSLRRSGYGPALDFRWLGIFGDSRFHSVFPIALRWSF